MSDKANSNLINHNKEIKDIKEIKETEPLISPKKETKTYGRFKVKSYSTSPNHPRKTKAEIEAENDLEKIFMMD